MSIWRWRTSLEGLHELTLDKKIGLRVNLYGQLL